MKYIRKFNESNTPDPFTVSIDDIKDYALDMIESGGFTIKVSKEWLDVDGNQTENPINTISTPIYNITLTLKEDSTDEDPRRWNGSCYYQDTKVLTMFMTLLKRLSSFGEVYHYIRVNVYEIQLRLSPIKSEIGFDKSYFGKDISDWFSYLGDGNVHSELYDRYDMVEGLHGGANLSYSFSSRDDKSDILLNLKEGDYDNKSSYDDLIDAIKEKLKKYEKYIDVNFDLEEKSKYKHTQKMGLFKSDKITVFTKYVLNIRIRPKGTI